MTPERWKPRFVGRIADGTAQDTVVRLKKDGIPMDPILLRGACDVLRFGFVDDDYPCAPRICCPCAL